MAGAGTVCVFQTSRPVSASSAMTNPRIPYPPPDMPTMTFPSTVNGAIVM